MYTTYILWHSAINLLHIKEIQPSIIQHMMDTASLQKRFPSGENVYRSSLSFGMTATT